MSNSKPDYTVTQPTFEEVVAYAMQEDLYGKLNIDKFYDYYSKMGFMYKGYLMDWKSKMKEWAKTQRTPVVESARVFNAKPKEQINTGLLDEIKRAFALA